MTNEKHPPFYPLWQHQPFINSLKTKFSQPEVFCPEGLLLFFFQQKFIFASRKIKTFWWKIFHPSLCIRCGGRQAWAHQHLLLLTGLNLISGVGALTLPQSSTRQLERRKQPLFWGFPNTFPQWPSHNFIPLYLANFIMPSSGVLGRKCYTFQTSESATHCC